jgi:hypothetical protein
MIFTRNPTQAVGDKAGHTTQSRRTRRPGAGEEDNHRSGEQTDRQAARQARGIRIGWSNDHPTNHPALFTQQHTTTKQKPKPANTATSHDSHPIYTPCSGNNYHHTTTTTTTPDQDEQTRMGAGARVATPPNRNDAQARNMWRKRPNRQTDKGQGSTQSMCTQKEGPEGYRNE